MESQHDMDFYVAEEKAMGKKIREFNEHQQHKQPYIVLSGFPYDQGTKRNHYRPGGAKASHLFREALLSYDIVQKNPVDIYDAGDIMKDLPLHQAHQELTKKHKQLLQLGRQKRNVLFSIGGSHDQLYANVQSLKQAYPTERIGVIIIDSLLNAQKIQSREQTNDQSQLYQILEGEKGSGQLKLVHFGANERNVCRKQKRYLLQKDNLNLLWMNSIKKDEESGKQVIGLFRQLAQELSQVTDHIMVSFDVSAISAKWMPGVSRANMCSSFTNFEAFGFCKVAGSLKKLKIFELSGYNPAIESTFSGCMLTEMLYQVSQSFGSN